MAVVCKGGRTKVGEEKSQPSKWRGEGENEEQWGGGGQGRKRAILKASLKMWEGKA